MARQAMALAAGSIFLLSTSVDALLTPSPKQARDLLPLAYSVQDQTLVEKYAAIEALQQWQETGSDASSATDWQQNHKIRDDNTVPLIPLATDPLLCISSQPILTEEECLTLMEWCQEAENGSLAAALMAEPVDSNGQPASEGAKILWKVQQYVHHELLGNEDGDYLVPRYLFYPKGSGNNMLSIDGSLDPGTLLPDGLHVDTNGCQHFRHWTVLIYLTSNRKSGATTFPLATPYPRNSNGSGDDMKIQRAKSAAKDMIYRLNQQHTRSIDSKKTIDEAVVMEDAAAGLWEREHNADEAKASVGVRVVPKMGHVCVFSGVSPDGYPNPMSFHGGEALLQNDGDKALLSFFYEVPEDLFSSREEFGQRVSEREQRFMERHFDSSAVNYTGKR